MEKRYYYLVVKKGWFRTKPIGICTSLEKARVLAATVPKSRIWRQLNEGSLEEFA